MSPSPLYVIGFAFVLLVLFSLLGRKNTRRTLRSIKAFRELRRTIELSVEDGSQLQISLGSGGMLGAESAAAFAGLTLLRQVALIAADGDQPPIATSGDAVLMLLAQDTLRHTYRRLNISDHYHLRLSRATGLSPFSYAAGTLPLISDRTVSASALVGSFGDEAGLITAASQQSGAFSLGGSNTLNGQALLFGSAQEPLIGEEVFATGAYMDAGAAHQASLRTQDVMRWLVILLLVLTAIYPFFAGLL
ncbi:MAG TPA: DUF6754 domain-containing protein [Anaerolineales bacterium]|nr:DUF6754 domain-containing protein [Anaerolineales bacterium]